jgi:hypothetical protein
MSQSVPPPNAGNAKAIRTIMQAWLVAGTLDIVAAMISFLAYGNKDLTRLFQYIASGVFGKEAYAGGTAMVIVGLLFHYIIALVFTIIFFLIYPSIRGFISRPIAVGLLYGILVWVVMNRIVLPLSNVAMAPFNPIRAFIGMVILMFAIGVPIAIIVNKHYTGR